MNKLTVIGLIFGSLFLTSCHRTSREIWEDTKTCGRYMKLGVGSIFGKHGENRDFAYQYKPEEDYTPMKENDRYETPQMQDYALIETPGPGDPGSKIPSIDKFIVPTGTMAAVFNTIYFETDKYAIRSDKSIEHLRKIADYLCKNPNTYIYIEGHCDQRGSAAYNLSLGSRRANSVRTFLIQHDVNPDQLYTISFGKERPISQGADEVSWKQNRRAQFKIYVR